MSSASVVPQERISGHSHSYLIPYLDGFVFYRSSDRTIALFNAKGAAALRDGLLAQRTDESEPPAIPPSGRDWGPATVIFSNTQKCTLRCTYCYAEGGRLQDRVIEKEVFRGAIDFVVGNAADRDGVATVNFLGEGESTADFKSLENIVRYLKEACLAAGVKPWVELSTNGVYPSRLNRWLADNVNSITFSLDGLPEDNRNRVLPNGKESFDLILANMIALDRLGKDYSLRSTVSRGASCRMAAFVEYMCVNTSVEIFHFEPAFDQSAISAGRMVADEEDAGAFISGFRESRRVAARYARRVYFSGAPDSTRTSFCGVANAGNFMVLTDGSVSACTEVQRDSDPRAKDFKYGKWNRASKAFDFNDELIRDLSRVRVDNMEPCDDCFARDHCAGDCYAKNQIKTGDMMTPALSTRCHITRQLVLDNLLLWMATNRQDDARLGDENLRA